MVSKVLKPSLDALSELDEAVHSSKYAHSNKLAEYLKRKGKKILERDHYDALRDRMVHAALHVPVLEDLDDYRESLLHKIKELRQQLVHAHEELVHSMVIKLPKGGVVTVKGSLELLSDALSDDVVSSKNTTINVVDVDQKSDGFSFANELAARGADVLFYHDAAMRSAIKHADVVFIKCENVTDDAIISPMGSELVVDVASSSDIPVYVVAFGLQYDPRGGERIHELEGYNESEVSKSHKGQAKVHQAAYEHVDPEKIEGIVSELGVFKHRRFRDEASSHYGRLIDY